MNGQKNILELIPHGYFDLFEKWINIIGKDYVEISFYQKIKDKTLVVEDNFEFIDKLLNLFQINLNSQVPTEYTMKFGEDSWEVLEIIQLFKHNMINEENKIKRSESIHINGDVVIGDPYLLFNMTFPHHTIRKDLADFDHEHIVVNSDFGNRTYFSTGTSYLVLFGDEKKKFNTYGSGFLIICDIKDARKINPKIDDFINKNQESVTVIKDYAGTIEVSLNPEEYFCDAEHGYNRNCEIYGYGNKDFYVKKNAI